MNKHNSPRPWRAWVPAAAFCVAAVLGPQADARPVAAEIALVLDVSGSISEADFVSQRDGWTAALRSPPFIQALNDMANAATSIDDEFGVAIGVYLFASNVVQELAWTWLPFQGQALSFANMLRAVNQPGPGEAALGGGFLGGATNLAEAVDRARAGMESNAFDARRRVVAVSANGTQNTGRNGGSCDSPCTGPVRAARDEAEAQGVTVSAVALNRDDRELDEYLAANLATADGITRGTWGVGASPRPYEDVLMHAITAPADDPGAVPEPGTLGLAALALWALRSARARSLGGGAR